MKRKKIGQDIDEGNKKRKEQKIPKEAKVLPNQDEKNITATSFPRRRIISKLQYGDILLREFDAIDCDGATIIEGIPKYLFNFFFKKNLLF